MRCKFNVHAKAKFGDGNEKKNQIKETFLKIKQYCHSITDFTAFVWLG